MSQNKRHFETGEDVKAIGDIWSSGEWIGLVSEGELD